MKLALRVIAIVILLAQFIRPDRTNPPVDQAKELHNVAVVPSTVGSLLRTSCYDCHSNETAWPWYAHVAPTSWFVTKHVNEGRRHLNFSDWGSYPPAKADHKLEDVVEYVESGEMPLSTYLPLHPEAKLTEQDRLAIMDWARWMREELGAHGEDDD